MRRNAVSVALPGLMAKALKYERLLKCDNRPPIGWAKNAIAGFGNPVYWRGGACRDAAGSGRPAPMIGVPAARHHDGSRASKRALVTGPNQVYARLSKEV